MIPLRPLGALALAGVASALPSAAGGPAVQADPVDGRLGRELALADHQRISLELPERVGRTLELELTLDGRSRPAVLERVDLRAPDFQVLVQDADGELRPAPVPPATTFRGRLTDEPGSRIAATLRDGALEALVTTAEGTFGVQPVRTVVPQAARREHVVYRAGDVLQETRRCGVAGSLSRWSAGTAGGGTYGADDALCELALDTDVQYFQDNGSDLAATVADAEGILNQVDAIFAADVDVTFVLTTLVVRTAEPDPYTVSDAGDLLEQFRDEWESDLAFVRRDVAHLFTGRNMDGETIGVAYLGTVCDDGFAYGLSESTFTPTVTSRVALTAHELGHNFGANHCDGTSPCRIMCASLGGCSANLTSFAPVSRSAITGFVAGVGCLPPDPPVLALPFLDAFDSSAIDDQRWPVKQGAVTSTAALGEPSGGRSLNLDTWPLDPANGDDLIVSARIGLAAAPQDQYLRFWSQHRGVEAGEALRAEVRLADGTWALLERLVSDGVDQDAFVLHELPLPPGAYHDAFRVRFRTEVDESADDWFLDDVAVDDQPLCPPPQNYCVSTANSFSPLGSQLQYAGSTSVAAGDLVLLGSNAAVNQPGIFYYGPAAVQLPLGNGWRCVGGVVKRLPLVTTDNLGLAVLPLDLANLPPGGAIQAGDTVHFQFWFRDPLAGGSAFNLSDGLRVIWCP